ncbi:hypothetical protein [Thalassobius sp. Cn5-15]|uniref:hypothetical protein n=1 Tax=Thalassobius sp. Cn5-15 TaxID=2917763 RepID=UPI001EF2F5E6|nr:hypothetical protein [Thalassobius sp. Cn5-15]MCG7495211.1 hypothetical protein [Thalassobius sp. Cn5-15]
MRKASPLFLERRSYRLRRLMDAARLMPFLGALLFAVPLLWGANDTGGVSSSRAMLYIFAVWAGMSGLTFVLSLFLNMRSEEPPQGPQLPPQSEGGLSDGALSDRALSGSNITDGGV